MKKLIILISSLLITFVTMVPCFCDEIVYVDIPNLNDVENTFEYTGNEIVCEIPESEYYTVTGNVQTEVGEYDAVICLSRQKYVWRNGSRDDLFYHFSIEKTNYDLSEAKFDDKVYIADGNSYSLYVENLPESINVEYSTNEISEPGNYLIVAMLTGDSNHYSVEPLSATLYLLEKPTEETTLDIALGNVSGYLPYDTELDLNFLDKKNDDYKKVSDILKENKVDENSVLDIVDTKYTYNYINIDCHELVTYNIANPEEEKVDIYEVNFDENGNGICKKAKCKTNSESISFESDISSYLVFVKRNTNYFLIVGIGIGIVALISLIVFLVIKKIKNKGDNSGGYRRTKIKKTQKVKQPVMYKRAGSK